MGPVLPLDIFRLRQPQKCFVYQGCGLQDMARLFTHHIDVGKPSQLCVDAGNNLIQRGLIATIPVVQEQSQVVRGFARHRPSLTCQIGI
jgi:hypothetical protein